MYFCVCVCVPACLPVWVCRVAMVQAISFQRKSVAYMLLVNPGNLFSIHQESGALSLTRPVDYEGGHTLHSLQVRASEPDTGLSGVAEVRRNTCTCPHTCTHTQAHMHECTHTDANASTDVV